MSVINNNLLLGSDGYNISRSLRLRSSATAYFNRTFGTPTNQNVWTYSFWMKRGALGAMPLLGQGTVAGNGFNFTFQSDDTLEIFYPNTGATLDVKTTQVFRDPFAWYHIVAVYDSTQATASNRFKLYVNGVLVTSFSLATYPTLNASINFNTASGAARIANNPIFGGYFDGYMTEVNFIDGQALTPSSFGETDAVTGVWKPKKYAGTYGTNGFYLNFSDNSAATATTIGKDLSGNANNWTPNNISVTAGVTYDSMLDVPTMWADGENGRGNYATLNPLNVYSSSFLSSANLRFQNTNAYWANTRSTIQPLAGGKYYVEFVSSQNWTSNNVSFLGLCTPAMALTASAGDLANIYTTTTAGEVLALAIDRVSNQVSTYRNNSLIATTSISATNDIDIAVGSYAASGDVNFGQRPFAYTPPTGFKALNTQNLPDATIKAGNKYFDASLYTGTSSSPLAVTNAGAFAPDLVWVKRRSATGDHYLSDTVRGVLKGLQTSTTSAEYSETSNHGVISFDSGGFTLGLDTGSTSSTNSSASTYAAWQWKKGATQGFDIVTYTGNGTAGRTVAHSLGVAPKFIITKHKDAADNWAVYHADLGTGTYGPNYLFLNLTSAKGTTGDLWRTPTSSNMIVGSDNLVNLNAGSYVSYLFAEVAGFSKFGSYTGNGSTDGPFVYLGFRPRFVLYKRTDSTSNWLMLDTSVNPSNNSASYLLPNSSTTEGADNVFDILSNGFKFRTSSTSGNASGGTYIFAAFAENPFKNSLAR